MSTTAVSHSRHAEHDHEQAALTRAYENAHRNQSEKLDNLADTTPSSLAAKQALSAHREAAIARWRALAGHQFIVGRLDKPGFSLHLGPARIRDADKNILVVNWATPGVEDFFTATPDKPGQVLLKRIITEDNGTLLSVTDDIDRRDSPSIPIQRQSPEDIPGPSEDVSVSDALLNELGRARDGVMHSIVATIQAEQYRIMASGTERPLVVDGGPGTGKTVVGLHRVAWLAHRREELKDQEILVVVPNSTFFDYTRGVLPALDIHNFLHLEVDGLYRGAASVVTADTEEASLVKGSAQMAVVLRRALENRIGWSQGDLNLRLGSVTLTVTAEEIQSIIQQVRNRGLPHIESRRVFRDRLLNHVLTVAQRFHVRERGRKMWRGSTPLRTRSITRGRHSPRSPFSRVSMRLRSPWWPRLRAC